VGTLPLDHGDRFALCEYTDGEFGGIEIRRRCVDNIKMDLREIGWDGVDWMDMAQDRDQCMALVNTVLNIRVP
jgi:hypothetical protein